MYICLRIDFNVRQYNNKLLVMSICLYVSVIFKRIYNFILQLTASRVYKTIRGICSTTVDFILNWIPISSEIECVVHLYKDWQLPPLLNERHFILNHECLSSGTEYRIKIQMYVLYILCLEVKIDKA